MSDKKSGSKAATKNNTVRKSAKTSVWWVKKRVDNGLHRFKRDFFAANEKDLPTSVAAYAGLIPIDDKRRPSREKLYPPPDAILQQYDSLVQAWWRNGYEVYETRESRRDWNLTPEIETVLRKLYSEPFNTKNRTLPGVKETAKSMGYPGHVFCRFALELGLTKAKEKSWSEAEIDILDQHGYKSLPTLAGIFRAAGFSRTQTAILLMRQRRGSHKSSPFYSLQALARLFGVDRHKVVGWVEQNWLQAEYRATPDPEATDMKGEIRVARKDSIYRFIVEHPEAFELRKVDQLWFLHLVTRGDVAFIKSDRLSSSSQAQLLEQPVACAKRRKRHADMNIKKDKQEEN